jgi:hypothetical protein
MPASANWVKRSETHRLDIIGSGCTDESSDSYTPYNADAGLRVYTPKVGQVLYQSGAPVATVIRVEVDRSLETVTVYARGLPATCTDANGLTIDWGVASVLHVSYRHLAFRNCGSNLAPFWPVGPVYEAYTTCAVARRVALRESKTCSRRVCHVMGYRCENSYSDGVTSTTCKRGRREVHFDAG